MYIDDQKKYLMTKLGLSGFYGMNDLISLYLKDRLGSDYDSVGQHEFYFRRPFTNVLRTINDQLFFTGDGSTNSAELVMPDGSSVEDKYLRSLHIYQTDWQGKVELSNTARTNTLTYSNDFSQWSLLNSGGDAPVVTTNYGVGPDGAADASSRLVCQLDSASNSNYSMIRLGVPYGSYIGLWAKSNVQGTSQSFTLGMDSLSGRIQETVGDDWQFFPNTGRAQARQFDIGLRGGDVISLSCDIQIAYAMATTLQPLQPYIPTNGATATITDYTRSGSTITFGQTPAQGATEEWSGAVYNHPITIESRKGTPLSDLVVERIEHKEGSDSFSVLTEGTDYTISGDTVSLDPEYKPTDCFYTGYAK